MKQPVVAATFAVAFFLMPLYPAFIALTNAPVPGVSLLPQPLAIALFALTAAIVVYWALLLPALPRRPMPTLLPLAALPAAALLSALLGFNPLAGAAFIAILVFGVIAHAAILRFGGVPNVTHAIFTAFLLSGILASLLAIALVWLREPYALYTIGHGRAIGTFVLPGELAGYLIVFVPVAFAFTRARHLDPHNLAWPAVVIGSVAFVLTFSRAGWVGMAAAFAVFVLARRRNRGGGRLAIAIACAAVAGLALIFNVHHDPSENFTRPSIWEAALQMIALFPLTGVGPFEFAHLYTVFRTPGGELLAFHAHSVILTIAAETGLVGLAALAVGWWRFAAELRARTRTDATYGVVATAIAAGLVGTWVQGLIDTVSIVIFGLWLPFMALALVCAGPETARAAASALLPRDRRVRRVLIAAATAFALLCGVLQFASSALFAPFGARVSLPAHLPEQLGVRIYDRLTRIVPMPAIDLYLVNDALSHRDLRTAEDYAARIPAGKLASETRARVAMQQGDETRAFQLFLDAGDDEALQSYVAMIDHHGDLRRAHELEAIIRDRLAADGTHPNALADSWWRLGGYAERLGNLGEAAADYDRATNLAPLNTKYLIDAGLLALRRNDAATALAKFTRATEIDPGDKRAAKLTATARHRLSQ